jgi:hypothetical protein
MRMVLLSVMPYQLFCYVCNMVRRASKSQMSRRPASSLEKAEIFVNFMVSSSWFFACAKL